MAFFNPFAQKKPVAPGASISLGTTNQKPILGQTFNPQQTANSTQVLPKTYNPQSTPIQAPNMTSTANPMKVSPASLITPQKPISTPIQPIPGVNTAQAATTTPTSQYIPPQVNPASTAYTPPNPQPQPEPLASPTPQTPDRFAQLNALEKAAGSYYQPTQQEQDTMTQLGNIESSKELGLAKISNNPEPMQLLTGQSDYLQKQAIAATQPLQAQLGILQARRQAAISGYQTALGAEQTKLGLQQPVQVPYGNQYLNPITGQPINSGGGSGSIQDTISTLADQVNNGTAYNDAVAQLPSQALAPMLLKAIMAKNPNFSVTTSNQNAGARGTALEQNASVVRPLVNSQQTAIQHLGNMKDIINKVGYSNFPLWNSLKEGWSNNVQSDPNIKQLQSEVNIVRGEVAKILGNGSVTVESLQEANQILPDKISPEQFDQISNNVQKLMQDKITQYTNLNNIQQFPTGQNNQGGQTNQGSQGGIYNF